MSRRRRQKRRNSRNLMPQQTTSARRSRNESGSTLSCGSTLEPRSCIFFGPATTVSTFELVRATKGQGDDRFGAPFTGQLVKGSESQFAIDSCATIRLSTPSYFREDGESLIWDLQEGYVSREPRYEERGNDPNEFRKVQQINAAMFHKHQLMQRMGGLSTERVDVRESEQSYLEYGDNCLILCTSIKPTNNEMWKSWRDSLEPTYDHVSTIHDAHAFAEALGAMAFQQKGLLGGGLSFRHPYTYFEAQCLNLPVVYGPVVYVKDRKSYINQATSNIEFVLRCIFAKSVEHKAQREFRFAITTDVKFESQCLSLALSPELIEALRSNHKRRPGDINFGSRIRSPSREIRRCFANPKLWETDTFSGNELRTTRIRLLLTLTGNLHKDTTTSRVVVQTANHVDKQAIEQDIENESTWPGDSRVVKCVLDGGSGNTVTIYDLGGITGAYRLSMESGQASMSARDLRLNAGEDTVRLIANDFDLPSYQASNVRRFRLSATTVSEEISISIESDFIKSAIGGEFEDLFQLGDCCFLVSAISADGTDKSAFAVIVGREFREN